MATLSLSWEGKTIKDVFVNLADPEAAATYASIEMMCENVQATVDEMFDQDSFNGFKVSRLLARFHHQKYPCPRCLRTPWLHYVHRTGTCQVVNTDILQVGDIEQLAKCFLHEP